MPDNEAVFAFFSLEGTRYDGPGMPAENVVEISYYRDAIYEVARRLWLDANGRARVPDGFPEAFDLRLTGIGPGSARPSLVLERSMSSKDADQWDEWYPFFTDARDLVTGAVAGAGGTGDLPSNFPRATVKTLKRVGASLRPDEHITLGSAEDSGPRANLDATVRAVLQRIDQIVADEPSAQTIEGVIVEFDGTTQQFRLRPTTGRGTIACVLASDSDRLARVAKDALAPDGITAPDVIVSGLAIVGAEGYFRDLKAVRAIEVVRSFPEKVLMAQLNGVRSLASGWFGEGAVAPGEDLIARVESLVPLLASSSAKIVIVASTEGHLVLEWRHEQMECSAELEPDELMYLCTDDTDTDALDEEQMGFDEATLVKFVRTGTWR